MRLLPLLSLTLLACGGSADRLTLRRVILYQNGIGYYERAGVLRGDRYRMQLRTHEVGDVLKSLVVIDRRGGAQQAVSAALPQRRKGAGDTDETWIDVLLQGKGRHELTLAYAAPTPVWRPTYRIVLPDDGGAGAAGEGGLLQAWGVVNNASGESWERVALVLATGAPLSFAIDLGTPRFVSRPDLSGQLVQPVATGMVSSERALAAPPAAVDSDGDGLADAVDKCPNEPETFNGVSDDDGCPDRGRVVITQAKLEILDKIYFTRDAAEVSAPSAPILDALAATLRGNPEITRVEIQGHACTTEAASAALAERRAAAVRYQLIKRSVDGARLATRGYGAARPLAPDQTEPGCARNRRVELQILQRQDADRAAPAPITAGTMARGAGPALPPQDVAGATRYPVGGAVSVPKGTATLVSMLTLPGGTEDIYLFRPDPHVPGSARHPLRAARVRVPLALEPGPVVVFASGSFVGEGMLERMHPGETALIPYAIDSGAALQIVEEDERRPLRLVSLHRGEAVVEDQMLHRTRYEITCGQRPPGRIFVRHLRRADHRALSLPRDTEQGAEAYLIPHPLAAGRTTVLRLEEERRTRRTLSLKESTEPLGPYLEGVRLAPEHASRLRALWQLQQDQLRAGTEAAQLRQQLEDLRTRAEELRENLRVVEKMASAATMRGELLRKLAEGERRIEGLQRQLIARTEAQAAAAVRLAQLLGEVDIEEERQEGR